MAMVEVVCAACGSSFTRYSGHVKVSLREGKPLYCSKSCFKVRKPPITTHCSGCGQDIQVMARVVNNSKTGRFFCSKSCSAKTVQVGAVKSESTKNRIREGVLRNLEKNPQLGKATPTSDCLFCGKPFKNRHSDRYCCSRNCASLWKFGSLPLTKDELVNTIQELVRANQGGAPSSKHVSCRVTGAAAVFFNTWNNMMKELGIPPNLQGPGRRRVRCKDGHMADSLSERVLDDWFFSHGIPHERNRRYPNSRRNCDFYLPDQNLWVEYAGLEGWGWYEETLAEKEQLAQTHSLHLAIVRPAHLYPALDLDWLLGKQLSLVQSTPS